MCILLLESDFFFNKVSVDFTFKELRLMFTTLYVMKYIFLKIIKCTLTIKGSMNLKVSFNVSV